MSNNASVNKDESKDGLLIESSTEIFSLDILSKLMVDEAVEIKIGEVVLPKMQLSFQAIHSDSGEKSVTIGFKRKND